MLTNYLPYLLALLGGALTPLAFAPVGLYPLAILGPACLLYGWYDATPKQAFAQGYWFGLGFFGVGVSWVFVSIHQFGNTAAPLAALFTLAFIAFLALYPALNGYLQIRLFKSNWTRWLTVPSLWLLLEWTRSWFLTGFPWLLLGDSQVDSPMRGFAPIVGTLGLSWILMFMAFACVRILKKNHWPMKMRQLWSQGIPALLLLGLLFTGYHFSDYPWTTPKSSLSVALVQGNIPQPLKWDENYLLDTLKIYRNLSQPYWQQDVIVWPEAAIPLPLNLATDFFQQLAPRPDSGLITGIPVLVPGSQRYYNAAVGFFKASGHYYKHHLVPFGEYVPLEHWLRGIINFLNLPMSDFKSGPLKQPLLSLGKIPIATFICYEIAYNDSVHMQLPKAQLLITLSNDAWFAHSMALAQHLQIARNRSLETGRYQLVTTNNGLTAIIDNVGKVQKKAPPYQRVVLTGRVRTMTGGTPWVTWGDLPIFSVCVLLLFFSRKRKRRS